MQPEWWDAQMLNSSPQNNDSALPAAQIRVTPEEITAALSAIEADKEQAARYREATVPIGQVVEELGLDATPEELWAQVQRKRLQGAAPRVRVLPRPRRLWGWLWLGAAVLFWVGLCLVISSRRIVSRPAIALYGNNERHEYPIHNADVEVFGSNDVLTLRGDCNHLTVYGQGNVISARSFRELTIYKNQNRVTWLQGAYPAVTDYGGSNTLRQGPP